MTSETRKQINTRHILPNISKSRQSGNKIWSLICMIFKDHAENEAGRLVADLFMTF